MEEDAQRDAIFVDPRFIKAKLRDGSIESTLVRLPMIYIRTLVSPRNGSGSIGSRRKSTKFSGR